ncbi:MAG: cytochrome c [bacterium]|nr:cytochrome c [bacterium]
MAHKTGKKFNVFDYFRDLVKFYGILYLFLLVFIIYLGTRYVHTLDYNSLYSAPSLLQADSNMRVTQPLKRGTISPPVDVMKFGGILPDDIRSTVLGKGKDLYNANCASCHGETGAGNGPAGATLNPPPRNFVDPSKQIWKNGPKVSNMYVTLQDGIPNTGMGSFANIPPEDRFSIIQYTQTFDPTYPKDSPEDLGKLDEQYSLSKGVKSPNQIPLDLAMDLVVLNYDTLRNDINTISWKIENDKSDTAAAILKEIISNKTKLLNALAGYMKWAENPEEFKKFMETDPLDKGIKGTVYQLSPENSNRIYQYLKNLFTTNRI